MLKLLDGIRVLDLTRLLPGPLCTLYLAELGAHVTKIDPEGDYARTIPPMAKKNSYAFLQLNDGKKFLPLNLKEKSDKDKFLTLVKDAHVVVESFRPGVTTKLGIDFDTLKKINPSIVYCSITGYGQTGPYKDYPGHDLNYLSYAGILEQMGSADRPELSNFQIADLAGGSLSACTGILAALLNSQKTKQAHFIDISMLDCVMGLNQVALATWQEKNKDVPRGKDILNGGLPFYSVYETKDHRFMALGALEAKFWSNFCKAVQKPEWISWHSDKPQRYDEFRSEITNLFRSKTMNEWDEFLRDKECCASPVLTISESIKNPQVLSRGLLEKKTSGEDGDYLRFKLPLNITSE